MLVRLMVALFALLIAVPGIALADDASPAYAALLSQLKSGFTDIDYGQLRAAFAASAGYDPYYRGGDDEKQLTEALKSDDCPKVVNAANRLLDANFTNITAHVFAASCARKLKDESSAQYHRKVAQGLLASIARSGDGQSPQSAYVVISVDEEYAFLSTGGYRVRNQSMVQYGQHVCDAIDVVDGGGAQKTVYFNVDRPSAWLAHKLPPKSADKAAATGH
jgi:hypothetical protein